VNRIVLALASLALAACVTVEINEESVFQPPAPPQRAAGEGPLDLKNQQTLVGVRVRHGFIGDGAARIAYTLAEAGPRDRPLFVHCGGNASDRYRAGVIYASKVLHWGDVLLFDYPGYGDSAGVANLASFTAMLDRVARSRRRRPTAVRSFSGVIRSAAWCARGSPGARPQPAP